MEEQEVDPTIIILPLPDGFNYLGIVKPYPENNQLVTIHIINPVYASHAQLGTVIGILNLLGHQRPNPEAPLEKALHWFCRVFERPPDRRDEIVLATYAAFRRRYMELHP